MFHNNGKVILITLMMYLFMVWFLFPYFKYSIEPDGIAYIQVAKHYVNGDFLTAINGYWSPLISWLLIPFIYLGLPTLLSFKILNILVGIGVLFSFKTLLKDLPYPLQYIGIFSTIPSTIYFVIHLAYPDLLAVWFLLIYFNILHKRQTSVKQSITLGLLGACCYVAKYYCLGFFILFTSLWYFILYLPNKTSYKQLLKSYGIIMFVFCLLSGIWISLLSQKYGYFTFSTAKQYNQQLIYKSQEKGYLHHPEIYDGFSIPTHKNKISAWEDPSFTTFNNVPLFSFFDQSKLILKNTIKLFFYFLPRYNLFAFLLLPLAGLILYTHFYKKSIPNIILDLLLFTFIFPSGYLLLFLTERYLIIYTYLIMALGLYLFAHFFYLENYSKSKKWAILVVFVLAHLYFPFKGIVDNFNYFEKQYQQVKVLQQLDLSSKARIASNDGYYLMHYYAFHLNWQYVGQSTPYKTEPEFQNAINNANIDYFFNVYDGVDFPFLKKYPVVGHLDFHDILIYKIQ